MDAIFELPPLPPHDAAPLHPVEHSVIAEWPKGTFLENLAVLDDGDIAVTVLTEARVDRVTLSGERSVLAQFVAPPTGIALSDGNVFVAVGEPGAGGAALFRIDPKTGMHERWMDLSGVRFANGLSPFDPGRLLLADSHLGQLFLIDLAARTLTIWIADERLQRAAGIDFLPGANGVKRFGDSIFVSSNGRAELYRAAVTPAGAGPIELVSDRLRVDDFAFDVDGAAYLCTHIGHSLDRLAPDGARVSLAGPDQGMAGSTACAFGKQGVERIALYVVTTGGIIAPPGGVLQHAKLVRLNIGAQGYPLELVP